MGGHLPTREALLAQVAGVLLLDFGQLLQSPHLQQSPGWTLACCRALPWLPGLIPCLHSISTLSPTRVCKHCVRSSESSRGAIVCQPPCLYAETPAAPPVQTQPLEQRLLCSAGPSSQACCVRTLQVQVQQVHSSLLDCFWAAVCAALSQLSVSAFEGRARQGAAVRAHSSLAKAQQERLRLLSQAWHLRTAGSRHHERQLPPSSQRWSRNCSAALGAAG